MNLKFNATKKQKQAIEYWTDDETVEIAFGGAKGGGKSALGVNVIFGDALIYPETHFFIAREELNDLRKHTIPSIYEMFKIWGIRHDDYIKYNGQDSFFTCYNGSKIFLLACKAIPSDPLFERFGSMQMTRGWIEEGGEISEGAKSNLLLSIGRWKNAEYGLKPKMLITCNPKKNWLYQDFYKPNKDHSIPEHRKFVQAFVWENPFIPKEYIENLRRTSDNVRLQRLFYGNWEYDDDPEVLLTYNDIISLFSNKSVSVGDDRCITADIALRGNDKFVICIWYGKVLIDMVIVDICGGKEVVDILKMQAEKHDIPTENIIYDADGLGGFVGGEGGFLPDSKPFINSSRPFFVKKENYKSLKAFCAHKFAKSVKKFEYYLFAVRNDKTLQERIQKELEQLKGTYLDDDMKMQGINSKDDMKKILGFSPDIMDACLMREYLPYTVKSYSGEANYA